MQDEVVRILRAHVQALDGAETGGGVPRTDAQNGQPGGVPFWLERSSEVSTGPEDQLRDRIASRRPVIKEDEE